MFSIIMRYFEKDLTYKGSVIVKYKIEFPQMQYSKQNLAVKRFNDLNLHKALQARNYAETTLFNDSKEQYEYNSVNGYPIMTYELYVSNTITYNSSCIISLYSDTYTYTGGAHGSTLRSSQNWNMTHGMQFMLDAIFPDNPYYLLDILKSINEQIKKQIADGTGFYFDDYCQLIIDAFRLDQFNIESTGISVYFQQYDIAPYSSGIPTFYIDFGKLTRKANIVIFCVC